MKIGIQDFAIGQIVPADAVAAAAPKFYAACEAARAAPYAPETSKLTDPFTMLGVMMADSGSYDYDAEQKRLKAAAKKGEVIVFGGEYLPQKNLRGQYFVAKCMGLARKRHPEADEEIRIQDATHSYPAGCTTPFTRELI